MPQPELATARLRLRARTPDDLEANLAMDLDPLVHRHIYLHGPPDPAAHRAELRARIASGWPPQGGLWVVEWRARSGFLGWCCLIPLEDSGLIEIGYRYRSSAVIGGSAGDPLIQHPDKLKAAPGTRAPHVVLERDGASISTLDLFGEHFVLLAGPEGGAWRAAAEEAASALGVPIDVWQIGGERGLRDIKGRFLEAYALGPAGAVLVRPDSFVAWRASDSAPAEGRALGRALAAILSRRTA